MGDTALLVIDVQVGLVDEPGHNVGQLLANIRQLLDRARASQTPVIYIQHCGPAGDLLAPDTASWQIHPDIVPAAGETVIRKQHPDSFQDTGLSDELARRAIRK